MKAKLLYYGFCEWQIDILLKKKKLNTSHGIYTLVKDELFLNNEKRELVPPTK